MISFETSRRAQQTYLVIVIVRQFVAHLLVYQQASFVCPGPGDVSHGITASAEYEYRKVEALDKVDAICMTAHAKVETSKSVAGQTISSTLQDDSLRPVVLHDVFDDGLKDMFV